MYNRQCDWWIETNLRSGWWIETNLCSDWLNEVPKLTNHRCQNKYQHHDNIKHWPPKYIVYTIDNVIGGLKSICALIG